MKDVYRSSQNGIAVMASAAGMLLGASTATAVLLATERGTEDFAAHYFYEEEYGENTYSTPNPRSENRIEVKCIAGTLVVKSVIDGARDVTDKEKGHQACEDGELTLEDDIDIRSEVDSAAQYHFGAY